MTLILLSTLSPLVFPIDDQHYTVCNQGYTCGGILKNIEYPFWGGTNRPQYCGRSGFELTCHENNYSVINIGTQSFQVLSISHSRFTARLARLDMWVDPCRPNFTNSTDAFSFGLTQFHTRPTTQKICIYYGCPNTVRLSVPNNFTCQVNGTACTNFYGDWSFVSANPSNLTGCQVRVDVFVTRESLTGLYIGSWTLHEALSRGFQVEYELPDHADCMVCLNSGGICGSNSSWPGFACLCKDRPYPMRCRPEASQDIVKKLKAIIAVVALIIGIGTATLVFFLFRRREICKKKLYSPSFLLSRNSSTMDYKGIQIFSYKELQDATMNFDSSLELGDGGFGAVYHGNLHDGRSVAVKRLYDNNFRRVEQFKNEIEILARMRHRNLVSLYGCTSRHSRGLLLVYEYIPNGTLADHLHGHRANECSLTLPIRLNIAVETASALSYLHASGVIHRDVKTDNILLDNNFTVKMADFGLSRLVPSNASHVSTAPQGTPGYVDPEYYLCYQLTDKSDVYSFGVVLIELISSMPAVDVTRRRHEVNLSSVAVEKIQSHGLDELVDEKLGFGSDVEARRVIDGIAEVAFWCLQNEKEMRPAMEEVVDILKGLHTRVYGGGVELVMGSPNSVTVNWGSRSTTPNTSC